MAISGGCIRLCHVVAVALLATCGSAAWAEPALSPVERVQYRGDQYRQDGYRQDNYRQDGYRQDGYRQDSYRQDDRQGRYGREQDDGRGRSQGMAGGSYQRSCSDIRQEGSTLRAVCRGERGRRFETSIDVNRCGRSDIGNDNGTLNCATGRGNSRRVD